MFACCCCCPLSRDTKAANGVAFRRWRQEVRAAGQPAWARQGGRYHRLETHGQERQCWRQGMPCGVSMKPAANLQLTTGTCSPPLAARLAARSAQPMVRTASLSTGRVHQCDKLAVRPLQAGAQQYQHPCNPSLQQHEKRSTSHPVAGHRQVDTRSSPVHSPLQHAPHLRGGQGTRCCTCSPRPRSCTAQGVLGLRMPARLQRCAVASLPSCVPAAPPATPIPAGQDRPGRRGGSKQAACSAGFMSVHCAGFGPLSCSASSCVRRLGRVAVAQLGGLGRW